MKLVTDVHRMSGNCRKGFQGQRSKVSRPYVYKCVNAITVEAYRGLQFDVETRLFTLAAFIYCLVAKKQRCKQLAKGCYAAVTRPGVKPTCRSRSYMQSRTLTVTDCKLTDLHVHAYMLLLHFFLRNSRYIR